MVHGNKESDVSEKEMLSTSWGSITKGWFMSPDQSLIGPPGLQSNLRPKTFITVKEFTQSSELQGSHTLDYTLSETINSL